jgi:NitT/TauT family transport system substrate-binding protein
MTNLFKMRAGTAGALAAVCALTVLVPAAQAQEAWRHGIVDAKADSGFLFQAAEGGFDDKHGVNIEMVQFSGGPTPLKALIAGDLDSFEASPVVALSAMHLGADVKIIGCDWPGMTYTVFSGKDIATPADLKGKTVGISSPGSLPDLFTRMALEASGLSGDDVKFANAGGSADRVKAVGGGVVAAAASSSEFAINADSLNVKPLLQGVEVTPQFLKVCIMTTGKKIAERREAMINFLAAEMEGLSHAIDNKDAMLEVAGKVAHLPEGDKSAEFIYDEAVRYKAVNADLAIPVDKLQWVDDQMVKLGALDGSKDVNQFIDDSLRVEALARIKK